MDFHKDLISKIKLKDKQPIYDILDHCLVKDLENSKIDDFKKYHADLLLAFIADEKDPTILKPYLRLLLKLYENNQWKLDLSTYSLIIRILCYLERYNEALSYLTRIDSLRIKITNRIIAPFFEKLSADFIQENLENFQKSKTLKSINLEMESLLTLINLFEKYNHLFLKNEYYYLLMKFNSFLKHFHKDKLELELKTELENTIKQNKNQNQKLTQELLSINEIIFKTFDKILKIWCNIDFVLSINFIEHFQYLNKEIKENQQNLKEIVLSDENQCSICGNYLKKHSLTDEERQLLMEQLFNVYNIEYLENAENNLIKFSNFIDEMIDNNEDYITYIIDGGNVGYSKDGVFNIEIIKSFINMIDLEHKKSNKKSNKNLKNYNILLVLHQNKKQYFNKIKKEKENDTEIKEKKDNCIIYYTPYNEYDDYYWLLASFMIKNSLTITNDKLKDHHVNKLDETLFNRWKNSHLTSYSRNASSDNLLDTKSISNSNYNFKLHKPLTYTKGTQKVLGDDKNIYHFPVQNNEELKWFCYTF